MFQISDSEDIEVVMPHQIANYDLTEKHWIDVEGMIPAKLYEELEKLTSVKMNAEDECIQHPNDESRFLRLESLKQNYETITQEAIACWTSHLLSNYIYSGEKFDILKDKIPQGLLEEIKVIDARIHDKNDPDYRSESLSQKHEELIQEAYNLYLLYRDLNPSDESNAKCQELFDDQYYLLCSESGDDSEHQVKPKKKKNKKHKNKK